MKVFKKSQAKILIALAVIFVLAFSFVANLKVSHILAKAEDEVTVEETDVDKIIFKNVSGAGYIGFLLTVSDYKTEHLTVAGELNDKATTYAEYSSEVCSISTVFEQNNSKRATLNTNVVYWDKGKLPLNYVGIEFEDTVCFPVSLSNLEYGFTLEIPAGTRFPSFDYIYGGFVDTPKVYQTKTDKAYYYDGSKFVEITSAIIQERINVTAEIKSTDLNLYLSSEREQVKELINQVVKEIEISFDMISINTAKANFYDALAKIMTVADYTTLANEKATALSELATFFGSLNQADYSEAAWTKILAVQAESQGIVNGVKILGECNHVVIAVKDSVNKVVTLAGLEEFESYRSKAITTLESSFVASLYLENEQIIGEALVAEGKQKLLSAVTYDEVDAIEAEYVSKLGELKTKAEWEEETPKSSESDSTEENPKSSGWIFAVIGAVVLLAGATVVIALIIKKNKKNDKKENKGAQNEE